MRGGLSTRIFLGFLVLLVVFAGTTMLSVRRLHAIREDLLLIHKGYLAMSRTATQVRTLQEAKDAYVARALAEKAPDVRRQLVAYAREFYPKALRDRLDEMEGLALELAQAPRLRADDVAFLSTIVDQIASAKKRNEDYDEVTARLLEAATRGEVDTSSLADLHKERGDAFSRELRGLAIAMDGKVADAVLRAERDERDAAFSVVLLALLAGGVALGVLAMMIRALRPLTVLVENVRAIGRGARDTAPFELARNDEIGALSRELSAMAKALGDREDALAARGDELLRLTGFAENVIRSVRVGIVVVAPDGCVRTLNPAARSVFALPLVDVDGRPLKDLIDAALTEPLAPVLTAMDEVRRQGELASFPMMKLGPRLVDVTLIPLRDRAGTSMADVLLLGEDVTAREETRERLLQSERLAAIGRLAAQITHEIRNPLSSVALNIELLGDDVPTLPAERQKEARQILDAVAAEVERLTQITEGYLRFARLPAPRRVAGDVGDLVADLVAFSQGDAQKAGVMLELNVEPDLPPVPHDPARMRQALLNLLRNGLEAAGRGGTVRVGARAQNGGARLSVEDTGPGVPDDVKERLFQPFFTTKPHGTGLGLLLTREIVLEHKGDLHVEKSGLGGASFVIDLPQKAGDPERAPADA